MHISRHIVLSAAIGCALLAGCAGLQSSTLPGDRSSSNAERSAALQLAYSGAPNPAPGVFGLSAHRSGGRGWMSPAIQSSNVLYIGVFGSNAINIYSQKGKNQAPIGQITNSLSEPLGLYVTKNGDLYAANYGSDNVVVFHKGKLSPYATLTVGALVSDITVDPKGTVYAVEYDSSTICVIPKGSTTCTKTLTDSYDSGLYWIASDSKGDLIVDGYSHTVEEFPAGQTNATQLPQTDSFPSGVAFDKKDDLLFTDGGSGSGGTIYAYKKPWTGSPIYTVPTDGQPFGIALNSSEKDVWDSNLGLGIGEEYSIPGGSLIDTTQGGLSPNYGIALEPPGKN